LEKWLAALGFHLIFVTCRPESFAEARAERLKVSGKPDQYNDLSVFIREQELIKRLVGESILLKFELDISDNDISRAVEKIANWME